MKDVEQVRRGVQWANPLKGEQFLRLSRAGDQLQITGTLPLLDEGGPCNLMREHERVREESLKRKDVQDSPYITFANADNDEKLLAFVQRFGPVVAHSIELLPSSHPVMRERLGRDFGEDDPTILSAKQNLAELRSERCIYSSALALVMELGRSDHRYYVAQQHIGQIALDVRNWPKQWDRERLEQKGEEPLWRLSNGSLQSIQTLSSGPPDPLLGGRIHAKIVMCELLNAFRQTIFPNAPQLHSSIRHGIRPLLYSILRSEFLYAHDIGVCANTQCRQFFEIKRAGQQFCTPSCSLRSRQREYWSKRGKTLRKKRAKRKRSHS